MNRQTSRAWHNKKSPAKRGIFLFVTENPAIVAWLKRGFVDERNSNKRKA